MKGNNNQLGGKPGQCLVGNDMITGPKAWVVSPTSHKYKKY